jgi:nucleoside-diphosphate-sugar epimerase
MVSHALLPGSRILVTGANGYIASHVVDQLLALRYAVRGTIRAPKPWLNEYFEDKYGKGAFERVIVPYFEDASVLEYLFDSVERIIHLVCKKA